MNTSPAPWSYAINTRNSAFIIKDRDGRILADPSWNSISRDHFPSREESEANVRLMAAAPELLDELKLLRQQYVSLMEAGRDRILALGGTCDSVDVMARSDPYLRRTEVLIVRCSGPQTKGEQS